MAEKTFTTTELAEFDGRNGHPAYVAVKGVVYDVSNVPQWKGGKHHGNLAGRDLTSVMPRSIHLESFLEGIPVVGKLVD